MLVSRQSFRRLPAQGTKSLRQSLSSLSGPSTATPSASPIRKMHKSSPPALKYQFPPGTWDCHMHVCGSVHDYPVQPTAQYIPTPHSLSQALQFETSHNIGNIVFVQPSIYGNDNSCLLDALGELGPRRGRGIVQLDPETIDQATLKEWHELGVRGVRINVKSVGGTLDQSTVTFARKTADAIRDLNWVIQIFVDMASLPLLEELNSTVGVPLCFDHFGGPDLKSAPIHGFDPYKHLLGFDALARMLRTGNAWVKLSASYRLVQSPGDSRLEKLGKEILKLRGDRVVFATDWPHTRFDSLDIGPWVEEVGRWCEEIGGKEQLERMCIANAKVLMRA